MSEDAVAEHEKEIENFRKKEIKTNIIKKLSRILKTVKEIKKKELEDQRPIETYEPDSGESDLEWDSGMTFEQWCL